MNIEEILIKLLFPFTIISIFFLLFIGKIRIPKTDIFELNATMLQKYIKLYFLVLISIVLGKSMQAGSMDNILVWSSVSSLVIIMYFLNLSKS